jgi:hypothetical protein
METNNNLPNVDYDLWLKLLPDGDVDYDFWLAAFPE